MHFFNLTKVVHRNGVKITGDKIGMTPCMTRMTGVAVYNGIAIAEYNFSHTCSILSLSVCLSVCLSACLPVCRSIDWSRWSISVSIYLSVFITWLYIMRTRRNFQLNYLLLYQCFISSENLWDFGKICLRQCNIRWTESANYNPCWVSEQRSTTVQVTSAAVVCECASLRRLVRISSRARDAFTIPYTEKVCAQLAFLCSAAAAVFNAL